MAHPVFSSGPESPLSGRSGKRRAKLAPRPNATSICRRRCVSGETCRRASNTTGSGTRCRLRSGEPPAWSACEVAATAVRALESRAGAYLGHHRDHRRVPPRPDAACLRRTALASAGVSISNFSAQAPFGSRRSADTYRLRQEDTVRGTCLHPSSCNRSPKGPAPAFPRVIVGLFGPSPVCGRSWSRTAVRLCSPIRRSLSCKALCATLLR